MQARAFIIPILIIALVGFIAAPPAQAELATVTALLAAGFITTVLVVETVETIDEESSASTPEDVSPEPSQQDSEAQAPLERSSPDASRP